MTKNKMPPADRGGQVRAHALRAKAQIRESAAMLREIAGELDELTAAVAEHTDPDELRHVATAVSAAAVRATLGSSTARALGERLALSADLLQGRGP